MDPIPEALATATFAGGCFWCLESDFEPYPGIREIVSGYAGGHKTNPSYEEVCSGTTGHVEAVQIRYDEDEISYSQLLDVFWRHVDPTDPGGQFVDRGSQYRPVVFYHDERQRQMAKESMRKLSESGRFSRPITTEIIPFTSFFPAETYHQNYYKKNPLRYKLYRKNSGRDRFLASVWSDGEPHQQRQERMTFIKPPDETLRRKLTPLQYQVTRQEGTEPPFDNAYWKHKDAGIYVDVVSGEPLFSSTHKFDSGTGWPSFYQPLIPENIVERVDRHLLMERTEVRSRHADSHLGHLFKDGPAPTGLRYCVNSAALRFIPRGELAARGYGRFLALFAAGDKIASSSER